MKKGVYVIWGTGADQPGPEIQIIGVSTNKSRADDFLARVREIGTPGTWKHTGVKFVPLIDPEVL